MPSKTNIVAAQHGAPIPVVFYTHSAPVSPITSQKSLGYRLIAAASAANPYPHAANILLVLQGLKKEHPSLFRGEAIYIWEDLAHTFETMDLPAKAVICYRAQSELAPQSTDPYLNLGSLYAAKGHVSEAITTYIYYNL